MTDKPSAISRLMEWDPDYDLKTATEIVELVLKAGGDEAQQLRERIKSLECELGINEERNAQIGAAAGKPIDALATSVLAPRDFVPAEASSSGPVPFRDAVAYRLGFEECREAAAQWHDQKAEAADSIGRSAVARRHWEYATAIRALQPSKER